MKLLIKKSNFQGLAAHIIDTLGNQLCHTRIKRAAWEIGERSPDRIIICAHCRRIQAQRAQVSTPLLDNNSPLNV
jgi:hypothetical protein